MSKTAVELIRDKLDKKDFQAVDVLIAGHIEKLSSDFLKECFYNMLSELNNSDNYFNVHSCCLCHIVVVVVSQLKLSAELNCLIDDHCLPLVQQSFIEASKIGYLNFVTCFMESFSNIQIAIDSIGDETVIGEKCFLTALTGAMKNKQEPVVNFLMTTPLFANLSEDGVRAVLKTAIEEAFMLFSAERFIPIFSGFLQRDVDLSNSILNLMIEIEIKSPKYTIPSCFFVKTIYDYNNLVNIKQLKEQCLYLSNIDNIQQAFFDSMSKCCSLTDLSRNLVLAKYLAQKMSCGNFDDIDKMENDFYEIISEKYAKIKKFLSLQVETALNKGLFGDQIFPDYESNPLLTPC